MKGYVISEVEVRDDGLAERYRTLAASSISQYGGRYLVRGATPDPIDGDWAPAARLVIVEFASPERAREWYASPEYAEARQLAETALSRRLLFADGTA